MAVGAEAAASRAAVGLGEVLVAVAVGMVASGAQAVMGMAVTSEAVVEMEAVVMVVAMAVVKAAVAMAVVKGGARVAVAAKEVEMAVTDCSRCTPPGRRAGAVVTEP